MCDVLKNHRPLSLSCQIFLREAFAAWIPGWGVPLSYSVAIAYVLVDTVDKGLKAFREAEAELNVPTLNPAVDAPRCELRTTLCDRL